MAITNNNGVQKKAGHFTVIIIFVAALDRKEPNF